MSRVNAVAPGFIATDMTAEAERKDSRGDRRHDPHENVWGESKDIAAISAFLASEDAGYITGQVFTVDGGMVM
jgi:3-oxoacyl-[acyl-carrier protein] reductase